MTIDEQLAELLHELTPEPPRSITTADIEARVTSGTVVVLSSRRNVWIAAIAAAAVVLAVAIGLAVTGNSRHAAPPAVTPTPTLTPSPVSLTGTVTLGGATVRLPSGWMASRTSGVHVPTWVVCSSPRRSYAACPYVFAAFPGVPGKDFSPDAELPSGLEGCTGNLERYSIGYSVHPFANRSAEYRQWRYECSVNGHKTEWGLAQYVVTTAPAFVLYTTLEVNRSAIASLDTFAGWTSLPAQTAPLPYFILGNVQSKRHASDGWHVTIVECTSVVRPGDVSLQFPPVPGAKPETFVIPDRLVGEFSVNLVGSITLTTDGHQVTELGIVGG